MPIFFSLAKSVTENDGMKKNHWIQFICWFLFHFSFDLDPQKKLQRERKKLHKISYIQLLGAWIRFHNSTDHFITWKFSQENYLVQHCFSCRLFFFSLYVSCFVYFFFCFVDNRHEMRTEWLCFYYYFCCCYYCCCATEKSTLEIW